MKEHIISRFIGIHDGAEQLIQKQLQQTWSRILFGLFGLTYLWINSGFPAQYDTIFLSSIIIYFTYNALTLHAIKRTPLSAFRILFAPLLDVWVVSLCMLMDGGQTSALYLIFLIIIFGNALRFGNAMLLYSQALAVVGVISVSLATLFELQLELNMALLFMQSAALIIMPAYVLQIRKQANTAIQAQQQAEEATFGLLDRGPLPAFTFHVDDEGAPRILYANLAMQHIYQNPATRLIGERVNLLTLTEDGDEIIRACQLAFSEHESAEPHIFYVRGKDPDDQILQFMGQSMRLHWHGEWVGVCFLLDITRSEETRNELNQSIHKSYMNTLVAGVVHDFRNVLTSIIGTAEVMSFTVEDRKIKEQLKLIMEAGERGSAMTSHLLSLSKTEHKQQVDAPTTEIIHQSLSSIIGLLRIQLPPYIQLHLDIQESLPAISISITEMEEIVTNLINNSTQAISETGHILVTLTKKDEERLKGDEKTALCIHVHDEGQGIPKENMTKITKAFWTSRKGKGGTGLGLAIVQRIVRDNGGIMDIQSDVNRGTDIYIYLPTKKTSRKEIADRSKEAANPEPVTELTPNPCTILLVDDNPEVLLVHAALLERMGHTLLRESNGKTGLQRLKQHVERIDMIITDYKMPVMDGVELSIAARKQKADIPILIITAYGENRKLQQAHRLGIHILSKPTTYKKLSNTIAIMQGES